MYKFVEKHKYEILAFLLSFLVGCLMFLPITILEKGLFFIGSDFNLQQMIFGEVMNYSLKEGSYLWTWFNDLGSDFIGTFSFYNLFSPFNIIGYLFPSSMYEYLIGPILILNPLFTKKLIQMLGVEKPTIAFEKETMDAYEKRLEEFKR